MSQPVRIEAIIPHLDHPNHHVVDSSGLYPTAVFEERTDRTYERTLDRIGHQIGACALSADQRLANNPATGALVYRTKPLAIALRDGYFWRNMEEM